MTAPAAAGRPRLVVGDDGSANADMLWLWVCNHAWPGWLVSVVTASPPTAVAPVGADRAEPHPWEPPSPRTLLGAGGDTRVEHLLAEADPRLALSAGGPADLVAVGPRGRGLLKHLHLGSTAEWLLSAPQSPAPVVVVRSGRRTRTVLLCVDGSAAARQATETLLRLPWLGTCRVTVLGVLDGRTDPAGAVRETVSDLSAAGGDVVPRLATALRGRTGGTAGPVVVDVIDRERPDLVVLGRGEHPGARWGSTVSAVAHAVDCSLLVGRAPVPAG